MTCVGFQPTIPMFEQTKTFHISDREATVIGDPQIKASINTLITLTKLTLQWRRDMFAEPWR
jgi:hypothetical protein